jgi:DNA-binding LytR/AlgR family response regulator
MGELFQSVTNCTVEPCHSYEEVFQLRDLDQFKMAFLDINLGQNLPSGIDVCKRLKNEKFPGKIFFFTGHAATHARSLQELSVEVLEKPVNLEQLKSILETL